MGHFTIYKDGEKIGTVLQLGDGHLLVGFNRRFPQYQETYGTPEQVRRSLRNMIPGAKYEPLDLPKLDRWIAFTDGEMTTEQYLSGREHTEPEGLMNI